MKTIEFKNVQVLETTDENNSTVHYAFCKCEDSYKTLKKRFEDKAVDKAVKEIRSFKELLLLKITH